MASLRDLLKNVGNRIDALDGRDDDDLFRVKRKIQARTAPFRQQADIYGNVARGIGKDVVRGIRDVPANLDLLRSNPRKFNQTIEDTVSNSRTGNTRFFKPIKPLLSETGKIYSATGAKLYGGASNIARGKGTIRDVVDTATGLGTSVATALGATNPSTILGLTGIGSGLSYLGNRYIGGLRGEELRKQVSADTQSMLARAPAMAGVMKFTDPGISKFTANLPFVKRILSKSLLNVGEGALLNTAINRPAFEDAAVDAIMPVGGDLLSMGGRAVSSQLKTAFKNLDISLFNKAIARARRNNIKVDETAVKEAGEYIRDVKGRFAIRPKPKTAEDLGFKRERVIPIKEGDKVIGTIRSPVNPDFKPAPSVGESAFGAVAGFEVDEDGNVTYNPEKGALGVGLMAGIKSKPARDLLEEARKYKSAEEFVRAQFGREVQFARTDSLDVYETTINRKLVDDIKKQIQDGDFVGAMKHREAIGNAPAIRVEDGRVIDGNHRLIALKELGIKEAPIEVIGDTGNIRLTNQSQLTDIWNKANKDSVMMSTRTANPLQTPLFESTGRKMRGFPETVVESPRTPKQVSKDIQGALESYYSPISNKKTVSYVKNNILNKGEDYALRIARTGQDTNANATAMLLIDKYLKNNQFEKADQLIREVSPRFTKQGQAIQILSLYDRLSPAGALRYTQNLVDKANAGRTGKPLQIGEVLSKKIKKLSEEIQKMPEGRKKQLKTAELVELMKSAVPPSLMSKVSAIQTMAQLLNPKTAIRNLFGNLAFQVGENVSNVIATPLDMATSLITGKRTRALPNPLAQARGFGKGLKEGIEESIKGVNTQPNIQTQFDLPAQRMFQNKILNSLEKALSIELRATDRAFYRAAFEDSISQQLRVNRTKNVTPEMVEQAHLDGLYRTFQDTNVSTKIFTGMKKALNVGKEFGLGDIIIKYPKTPANLLMRAVEYSPANFINTVYQAVKPVVGKPFNQREFVDSFSRALVGTGGLLTTGYLLEKAGVITGTREKDRDINAIQNYAGLGQYKINVDALKRFALSGLNPEASKPQEGDTLISYDWMQPFAVGISMGANISQNNGEAKGAVATVLNSLQSGTETLAEQPLVQGLQRAFSGYGSEGFISSIVETVKGTPASFVPTALSQVNQVTDNTRRDYRDPSILKESINLVKYKTPILSQTLPERYNIYGQVDERYQGGTNNAFNVFLNPAFVSKLRKDPTTDLVLDMYVRSGQKTQAPRVVPTKVTINGKTKELTAQETSQYQQYVGVRTKQVFDQLSQNPLFLSLSDDEKAKRMQSMLTDINTSAKIELFGNEPKNVSRGAKMVLAGDAQSLANYNIEKAIGNVSGSSGKGKKPKLDYSSAVKSALKSTGTARYKFNPSTGNLRTADVLNRYRSNLKAPTLVRNTKK